MFEQMVEEAGQGDNAGAYSCGQCDQKGRSMLSKPLGFPRFSMCQPTPKTRQKSMQEVVVDARDQCHGSARNPGYEICGPMAMPRKNPEVAFHPTSSGTQHTSGDAAPKL